MNDYKHTFGAYAGRPQKRAGYTPAAEAALELESESQARSPARATRADVRNPVLALPAMAALRDLPPESRAAMRAALLDLRADARARAEKCWRTHKAPMAAYWKAVSVYSGHIAKVIA
jgi:hypothetical protein